MCDLLNENGDIMLRVFLNLVHQTAINENTPDISLELTENPHVACYHMVES